MIGAFFMLGRYRAFIMHFLRRWNANGKQNQRYHCQIGGETTKLQTALKGVNGQIKNTQSALRDVERLLKLDPHKINFSLELKLIIALFISFSYILHQYFF